MLYGVFFIEELGQTGRYWSRCSLGYWGGPELCHTTQTQKL